MDGDKAMIMDGDKTTITSAIITVGAKITTTDGAITRIRMIMAGEVFKDTIITPTILT